MCDIVPRGSAGTRGAGPNETARKTSTPFVFYRRAFPEEQGRAGPHRRRVGTVGCRGGGGVGTGAPPCRVTRGMLKGT
ncbi:hypothetical protein NL676_003325 [Syzygium grande]|nr:hypothetical protein NL676_003325 [Syzygium grande]